MNVFSLDTTKGTIDVWLGKISKDPNCPKEPFGFKIKTLSAYTLKQPKYSVHIEDEILDVVMKVFTEAGINTPDLAVINLGPGSFTSTRVGLSFLKGWYQASKTKFLTIGLDNRQAVSPKLPKRLKVVIIDRKVSQALVNALLGFKEFLERGGDDILSLKPIYNGVEDEDDFRKTTQKEIVKQREKI